MEKQKSGKKKLGSWLKKLVQHKDKGLDHQHRDFRISELQYLSPLSAHSNRKKQHLATQQLAARHAQDDCGQQLASSDQEASQVARCVHAPQQVPLTRTNLQTQQQLATCGDQRLTLDACCLVQD